MENFGAEIRELCGLAIGDFGNRSGFGNETRVGAEDAVDVRPDDDFVGAERAAENRGGIVRTAAAESGEDAIGCSADESGDYGNDSLLAAGGELAPRNAGA